MRCGIGIHLFAFQKRLQRGIQAHVAAMLAGAGAHVHQPVCAEHGFCVVLHHHHGVALVPEGLEGSNEFAVVLLVQADRRLIQNVQHIHQFGANLRGQADALTLAAGERPRGPVQRQVVQAHIQHELHAFPELLQDVPRHVFLPLVEAFRDGIQPLTQLRHFHGGYLRDGLAVHPKAKGLRIQARALTDGTGDGILNVVDNPAPAFHLREVALSHAEKVLRTKDKEAHSLVREGVDGVIQTEIVFAGDGPDDVEFTVFPHLPQRHDATVRDGLAAVRNDGVHVHVHNGPEALAMGAIALRRVEGEAVRLRFLQGQAALRVHQVLGIVGKGAGFLVQDGNGAFSQVECPAYRLPHAAVVPGGGLEPVHHQFYEVGLVSVQCRNALQLKDFSVYTHFRVAAFAHLVEEFPVVTFSAPDNRREKVAFAAAVLAHDEVHDLGVRVADHFPAAFRGIGPGAFGIQQAQEVVDFRDGAHRGTGVVAGGFLLDGNDGAQAGNFLYLRLFQDAHEVLGIGGQGIHIAALALCVDGVKGQRTFSRPAEPGYHHKFPPGDGYIHVFEVVGPGAPHLYVLFLCHRPQRYEEFAEPCEKA